MARPPVAAAASKEVHSARLVGLLAAKTTGRSAPAAAAARTSRVKMRPAPERLGWVGMGGKRRRRKSR